MSYLRRASGILVPVPVRPAWEQQPSLGAFDPDDPGGVVSRVCPAEQLLPPDMWRGDFAGVTLPPNLVPPIISPVTGQPFGANTTPVQMGMSFLLPFYNRLWQDIWLTAHAQRAYTYFHLDWLNAQTAGLSATQFVQLIAYVQSWGFRTSFWGMGTPAGQQTVQSAQAILQPVLDALIAAGPTVTEKTILIFCEETNSCMSPATLDGLVVVIAPQCLAHGIRMRHHFTSRYPAWPLGGQSSTDFWGRQSSLGVEGLCYQSIPTDPSGTMMAAMWDTRTYMGQADVRLKCTAFEMRANEQLYGRKNEQDGCRTGLEATYATRGSTNYPAVDGYGNGGCLIDGMPL